MMSTIHHSMADSKLSAVEVVVLTGCTLTSSVVVAPLESIVSPPTPLTTVAAPTLTLESALVVPATAALAAAVVVVVVVSRRHTDAPVPAVY
jgi:hypothetical protein